MSRTVAFAPFSLALVLAALAPSTGHTQSNAPLTGSMTGGGVAQATPLPATPPAAAPAAPAAQMPSRPVSYTHLTLPTNREV